MKILFHFHTYKIHFHMKGCALGLILKVRVFGTRKWPIMRQSIPASSKFPGAAGTPLSCQIPRSGKEKRQVENDNSEVQRI